MNTPADKRITFTFMSPPALDRGECWQAKLEFPPGAGAETMLPLRVWDGNDVPVEDGVVIIAGTRLRVKGGETALRYSDFVKGKHDPEVWLRREGLPDKPAYLTFA